MLGVVRCAKVTPEHIPPLEKVTDTIRDTLVDKGALALAVKTGQEARAKDREISDQTKAPEGFGSAMAVSRVDTKGLNKEILDTVLAAPTKPDRKSTRLNSSH